MILLISDDLLDASKTTGSARAGAIPIMQCKSLTVAILRLKQNEITCCIADLQCPGLDVEGLIALLAEQKKKPRVIAYGSHVDAALLSAARKAGCDEVMPRSQFFEEMPAKIAEWAKPRAA